MSYNQIPVELLFVDHAAGLGGAEHSLLLLLKYLDKVRFTPRLISVGGPLAEAAQMLHVPVHTMTLPRLRQSLRAPLTMFACARAMACVARDVGARALIANTVRAAWYAAPAARLVGNCSFVWYLRDFWLGESKPRSAAIDRWGKRALCAAASGVITNSLATAAHVPCVSKVTSIHNGVEVERFDPKLDDQDFRREQNIPPGAPVLGMVGRLRPWKGQDRFLRIFAHVHQNVPNLHGLVVGGNPFGEADDYASSLKALVAELEIGDRVHFTGQIADPRPALAAMDVFVHPGDPEPFGLVNVEAMAMAKSVVAFAHGALPEIVLEGETGVLVAPVDEHAMAMALEALLRDPERRERLGRQGRSRAEEYFDVRFTVQRFEESLLSRLET